MDDNAKSSYLKLLLQKYLASEDQMRQHGFVIAGKKIDVPIRIVNELINRYGGQEDDWVKASSTSFRAEDGTVFETHWYDSIKTQERVEIKVKLL